MNNLFVMHTQYNLILAIGIIETNYKECKNDLLLYAEFKLSLDFKNKLENIFNEVIYIQEEFEGFSNTYLLEKGIYNKLKKSKLILKNKYDNIFLTQEEYYDTLILTKLNTNNKFKCINIEEDAYFSLDNKRNNYSLVEYSNIIATRKSYKSKIVDCLRLIVFGKNTFYRDVYCYGMSPIYSDAFVMFPNNVRKELMDKNLHEITARMITGGVNNLYFDINYEIKQSEKYLLFFFDLINRYQNKEIVEQIVNYLVDYCMQNNITFLYKYHPRETDSFMSIDQNNCCFKLPTIVPSEKIIVDLFSKNVTVVGNMTTAIMVAAKFLYKTVSISKLVGLSNDAAFEVFKKCNISVPENFDEFANLFR